MNEYETVDEVTLEDEANDITAEPALTPAQERLQRDASAYDEDMPVYLTDDGYQTSVDVAGPDVVDFGMSSVASVRGMGADLDSMPGDETPISR